MALYLKNLPFKKVANNLPNEISFASGYKNFTNLQKNSF
jgi:hypothetical protein